jgi:hypothetical protein
MILLLAQFFQPSSRGENGGILAIRFGRRLQYYLNLGMRNGELVSSLQCVYHYRFIRLLAEVEKTPKKHKAEGRGQKERGKCFFHV